MKEYELILFIRLFAYRKQSRERTKRKFLVFLAPAFSLCLFIFPLRVLNIIMNAKEVVRVLRFFYFFCFLINILLDRIIARKSYRLNFNEFPFIIFLFRLCYHQHESARKLYSFLKNIRMLRKRYEYSPAVFYEYSSLLNNNFLKIKSIAQIHQVTFYKIFATDLIINSK